MQASHTNMGFPQLVKLVALVAWLISVEKRANVRRDNIPSDHKYRRKQSPACSSGREVWGTEEGQGNLVTEAAGGWSWRAQVKSENE